MRSLGYPTPITLPSRSIFLNRKPQKSAGGRRYQNAHAGGGTGEINWHQLKTEKEMGGGGIQVEREVARQAVREGDSGIENNLRDEKKEKKF